ncbi:hypothetical protein NX059_006328 [Plenodomus lindquistii]|nr:hypothetical protein NX059_006328 [Plenodomus lindquistii]
MRPSQILAAVMAMSSLSAAMQVSDVLDNIHGVANVKDILLGRQDNNNNNNNENNNDNNNNNSNNDNDNASSDAPRSTQASERPTATQSGDNNNDNNDSSTTDRPSGSGRATGTGTGRGTRTSGKPKTYDPRLPAGGISMITPAAIAGDTFYKVGDWVTFAWNYTSLSQTPSNIDVLASCTANQATYTIAVNMSAKQTEVLWNTGETPEGQAPFLTNKYTLLIYDSDSSVSAAPQAGYLAPFSGLSFGMYTPQPYVDYSDGYTCPNCNGALSQFERMTISALLMTTGTTIGSLIYFTYAFGLW